MVHGVVRAFEWANPHVWLWIVSDETGSNGRTFAFEGPSINELTRFGGWDMHVLRTGDKITVVYAPLRNGKDGGSFSRITLATGGVLVVGQSEPPTGSGTSVSAGTPRTAAHP
jgi:hypothetical protein